MREPTAEQLAEWQEWLWERPPAVREVAERLPPWKLYRMTDTGQRVRILQYDEHHDDSVTLTVSVDNYFNFVLVERNVFGIDPAVMEPCSDYRPWWEAED